MYDDEAEIKGRIIGWAREWLGVPYLHQGRSRLGVDCVGVIVDIAKRLNMSVQDWQRYPRVPHAGRLLKSFRAHLIEIPSKDLSPADVVLMSWRQEPHHAGIISRIGNEGWDNTRLGLIHCNMTVGRVVEHTLDEKWRKRIKYVFQYPTNPWLVI